MSAPPVFARLALVLSAFCFGLMAVLARKLSQPAMGFTAGHLSVLRFLVGLVMCLVAFRIWPHLYAPRSYRILVARGVSGGLVVVLYFYALARIPAGEAGLIYNLFPMIATAMALVVFRERPTLHLLLAVLLVSLGVALVLGRGHLGVGLGRGEGAALSAAVFAAISANIIRASRSSHNALIIFFFFCLVGLFVVVPFALDPWPRAPLPWLLGILMGLAALAAQVLMGEAFGSLSVAEASVWLQLTPIATYLLAVPLLGEPVSSLALAGVLLTVAGVVYGTLLGRAGPVRT